MQAFVSKPKLDVASGLQAYSDEIIAKGIALAADMLEASEADIRFEADHAQGGRFVVSGTDQFDSADRVRISGN